MRKHSWPLALFFFSALGATLWPRGALADATVHGISAGPLIGLAIPSSSGASTRFSWGIEGDYSVLPEIDLGAYILTSSQDSSIPAVGSTPAVTSSNSVLLYGVQGKYHFGLPGLSVGARMGVANSSTDVSGAGSISSTSFSIGPYATFDHHVSPQISVGGDFGILFATATNSYNVLNLLGSIKYWF